MPIISIIIPIYNAEVYLRRCIDSILVQTFTDFECILINDGSTDNSSAICKEYKDKDFRVRYYYQDNSGPAVARNNGINKSRGNLVMFVDADDWIEHKALETFYEAYEKSGADMIISTAYNFFLDGILHRKRTNAIDINIQSPLVYYLTTEGIKSNWNKLMCKQLWVNLYIPEKSNFEDYITGVQIFSKIDESKIVCIDVPVYNQVCDTTIRTLSYMDFDDYNKPFGQIKQVAIFDWIKNYILLSQKENMSLLDAAFSKFYMQFMGFPYLIASKYVIKEEVHMFWEYYKKSIFIWGYPFHHKMLISMYHSSLILGKIFQYFYGFLRCTYIRLCRLFQ